MASPGGKRPGASLATTVIGASSGVEFNWRMTCHGQRTKDKHEVRI